VVKKVLAGIIVYNPSRNLVLLVDKLIEQDIKVILFINKGNRYSENIIKNKNVIFKDLGKNIGVSSALNEIIKEFMDGGFPYLFTFDQDSMIDSRFIKNMLQTFEKFYLKNKNIVCCSPSILDIKFKIRKSKKLILQKQKKNNEIQYVNFAITSGSLFNRESFKKVGNMNNLLFIDGVDTDWCERAVLLGFNLIKAQNIFLKHKIGSKRINFFGIKKSYHDQDLRVYYIMRNSLYLLLYGSNTFRWKLSEILRTIIRFLAYPILSSTKTKTLFYIFLAFKDVFKGNMGKMSYIDH
tara:strand:+ start:100 stop:984 length:885 start_codon:yes stop_codon:yes gene_type:complete